MADSTIPVQEGGTNVYADLAYDDAAEMQRKSALAALIAGCIARRRLSPPDAALLLGVDQGTLSRITRGMFRRISELTMLDMVTKLGRDVRIIVGPAKRRKAPGSIRLEIN